MSGTIATGGVHHLRLTVTDVDRARDFYTQVLGFAVVMDLNPGVLPLQRQRRAGARDRTRIRPPPRPATASTRTAWAWTI